VYFDPLVPEAVPTDTLLKSLHLTPQEIADVVAFLMTLTDPAAGRPRQPVPDTSACRDG
jgi:hypothetical protein